MQGGTIWGGIFAATKPSLFMPFSKPGSISSLTSDFMSYSIIHLSALTIEKSTSVASN